MFPRKILVLIMIAKSFLTPKRELSYRLPSLKLTNHPWKLMVRRWSGFLSGCNFARCEPLSFREFFFFAQMIPDSSSAVVYITLHLGWAGLLSYRESMQNRFYCQLSCGKKNCLVEWKLYPLWNCCGNRVMKRDKVFFRFLLFIYRLFFFLVAHLDVCSSKDSHPAQPEMCAQRCFCLKNFRIRLDSLVRYEFHWFNSCRGRLRAEKKVGVGGSVFRAWKELPKCTKWRE